MIYELTKSGRKTDCYNALRDADLNAAEYNMLIAGLPVQTSLDSSQEGNTHLIKDSIELIVRAANNFPLNTELDTDSIDAIDEIVGELYEKMSDLRGLL